MRRLASSLATSLAASLALWLAPAAAAFDALDYYPLGTGDSWTFSVTGFDPEVGSLSYAETETAQAGTFPVNGVATRQVLTTSGPDAGVAVYSTNDALGLRMHRAFSPDVPTPWGPRDITQTFSPPLQAANAVLLLGDEIASSGTWEWLITGVVSFGLVYEATSRTAPAWEWITVPAGTFLAVRFDQMLSASGEIDGEPFAINLLEQIWLASGIGPVRSSYSDSDGASSTRELTATTLVYTPEPSSAGLGTAALGALVLLGWRTGWTRDPCHIGVPGASADEIIRRRDPCWLSSGMSRGVHGGAGQAKSPLHRSEG